MQIEKASLTAIALLLMAGLLSGCATGPLTGSSYQASEARTAAEVTHGTVTHKRFVTLEPSQANKSKSAGIGAILGGLLGHAAGGGTGKLLATVGGVVAGGVIGSHAGQALGRRKGIELTVQLGRKEIVVVQQVDPDFTFDVGQHVLVIRTRDGITRVAPATEQ